MRTRRRCKNSNKTNCKCIVCREKIVIPKSFCDKLEELYFKSLKLKGERSSFTRKTNDIINNTPLFSDEIICRAHDRLLAMEKHNDNLPPNKMRQGLFNFYGDEEVVGIDRNKAYASFCRPEPREKEVDDRRKYW